jgi:hypothetical protein
VYNIQKGNTDVEINFYMGINNEKVNSHEDYVELRIFIFYLSSKSSVLSKGDTLGELVKCETLKSILPAKNPC